jgi:DNA-binding CsgD family transcriptional regulator
MAFMSNGDFSKIVDSFSAAALDSSLWVNAMDVAAKATGSKGAFLLPVRGHLPTVPTSESVSDALFTYSRDGWYLRDERHRGVPILNRRGVMTDLDFLQPGEEIKSPYYQEMLAPLGLRYFIGLKVAAGEDFWCLAIQRSPDQGLPSAAELQALGRLSANLSGAAAVAQAVRFSRIEGALEAFEISGSAVALVDRHGEVFRINRASELMLKSANLRIRRKKLVSRSPEATAELDRALHALIWSKSSLSLLPPVVLPRTEGRPILAYPSRLPGSAMDAFDPCQAIVVFVDLEQRISLVEADLMHVFSLTLAEARLANRLLYGETIERAAQQLRISYETSRSALKVIFRKTGTHRQSELVAVLSLFKTFP